MAFQIAGLQFWNMDYGSRLPVLTSVCVFSRVSDLHAALTVTVTIGLLYTYQMSLTKPGPCEMDARVDVHIIVANTPKKKNSGIMFTKPQCKVDQTLPPPPVKRLAHETILYLTPT